MIASGGFDLSKDWKNLLGAAMIAAFSFCAKDFDVTGNPPQTIVPAEKAS